MSKKPAERKAPWLKFYTADWRADPGLRMCNNAARGLWIDLLTLMHEAEPYGHLLVGGINPKPADLARILGGGTPQEYAQQLAELEEKNVFSRTKKGVIYSRRMVNDEVKVKEFKEFGKRGGNPSLKATDNPPVNPGPKGRDKGGVNPTLNGGDKLRTRVTSTRVQSLESKQESAAACTPDSRDAVPIMPALSDPPERWMHLGEKREVDDRGICRPVVGGHYLDIAAEQVCEAARINSPNWRGDWRPLMRWLRDGIDIEETILPTIRNVAKRPAYKPPGSLNYFDDAIRKACAA